MAGSIRSLFYANMLSSISSGKASLEDVKFPTDSHKCEFLREAASYFSQNNDKENHEKAKKMLTHY